MNSWCCCCWWYSGRCYATASTVDLKLAVVLNHDGKLQQHFLPVRRASKNWLAWKLASLARNTTCLACRSMSWLSSVLYEAVSAQFPLYVQRTKFGLLRKSSLPLAENMGMGKAAVEHACQHFVDWHCNGVCSALLWPSAWQACRASGSSDWQQQLLAVACDPHMSAMPRYGCHSVVVQFASVLAAILIALFYCCNEVVALTICNAVGKFVNCTASKPRVLPGKLKANE